MAPPVATSRRLPGGEGGLRRSCPRERNRRGFRGRRTKSEGPGPLADRSQIRGFPVCAGRWAPWRAAQPIKPFRARKARRGRRQSRTGYGRTGRGTVVPALRPIHRFALRLREVATEALYPIDRGRRRWRAPRKILFSDPGDHCQGESWRTTAFGGMDGSRIHARVVKKDAARAPERERSQASRVQNCMSTLGLRG